MSGTSDASQEVCDPDGTYENCHPLISSKMITALSSAGTMLPMMVDRMIDRLLSRVSLHLVNVCHDQLK
jgi:hypothetical protein